MILEQIEILNYRSIAQTSVVLKKINSSSTYCLLGINESGKSSFLNGVSLFDSDEIVYPQDFFDESQSVKVAFKYKVPQIEVTVLRNKLIKTFQFPKDLAALVDLSTVTIVVEFPPKIDTAKIKVEVVEFKKDIIKEYTLDGKIPIKIEKGDTTKEELNLKDFFLANLPTHFWSYSHTVLFWESSEKYLINDEIELTGFAADPETISVPLTNCFRLAGIESDKIAESIQKLIKPAPIRNLESVLSESVTEHIKKVWPEHPIEIKFEINNNKISLLIEDEGVKHKAKTTSQRSDGFRQFISFLLTLSAENLNEELTRTVLLIDEPETHLHPQAQINLKEELIKITSNDNDNIVFYATHSNYMIDKKNLERNIKVTKTKNEKTELTQIPKSQSSYSEVNYTVFNIPTVDYHNELYGYLEDVSRTKLESLQKDKKWFNEKLNKEEQVSLSKYIRNSIHHPENTSNKMYTEIQLKKSIEILRKLKYG